VVNRTNGTAVRVREAQALLKRRFDDPVRLGASQKAGISATGEAEANERCPNEPRWGKHTGRKRPAMTTFQRIPTILAATIAVALTAVWLRAADEPQPPRADDDAISAKSPRKGVPLFDGRTFHGWEGDTKKTFRLEDGAIVGGSLKEPVPRNEFLCTTRGYANFVLRLECKLVGPGNAGIQVRSQRVPNHHEVSGYQADMSAGPGGGYWGCLYDESRRNRMLARADREVIQKALKPDDWNVYEIRCQGPRIRLSINGVQTVDYTETDDKIPPSGIIGLQIHGGQPSEAWYRNITIDELP